MAVQLAKEPDFRIAMVAGNLGKLAKGRGRQRT